MPLSAGSSGLIAAVHAIQGVYEDAIWLVWYERGVWDQSHAAAAELTMLEKVLKECYDVIDLVTLAAIERFGEYFRTTDADALAVLRGVMAELDTALLGPVQRGPSQRQFRKGSLKPTSHLMNMARSSCAKVVNVLEDINESLLHVHTPMLARRRSSSWVPTSEEAKHASVTAYPGLRRTSSLHMETGSMASRFSIDSSASIRKASRVSPYTRNSNASLARQYSKRGYRKDSLFFTDSINITTGTRKKLQLSISIQRGGNGPLKYTLDVPDASSAQIDRIPRNPIAMSHEGKVTVFHDPFASSQQNGNVNISVNLRTPARSSRSAPVDRRMSRSAPTSPVSEFEPAPFKSPRTGGATRPTRSSSSRHRRSPTHADQISPTNPTFHYPSPQPRTIPEDMVSPGVAGRVPSVAQPLTPVTPTSQILGAPALALSAGFHTPNMSEVLDEPNDRASVMTTSSFGTSVMSYMRNDSIHGSCVSLYSTANGPVPDVMSVRSSTADPSMISPISESGATHIDDAESTAASPHAWAQARRRSSSIDTVTSASSEIHWTGHHQRHSTAFTGITSPLATGVPHGTTTSPLRTFFDASLASPRLSKPFLDPAMPASPAASPRATPTDPATDPSTSSGASGGVRLSMLSAARDLSSRSATPIAGPWNDYLGFCAGAFWAQSEQPGALKRRHTLRPAAQHADTYLACANMRCGFATRAVAAGTGARDEPARAVTRYAAAGVRLRPRFLVKSHVQTAAAALPEVAPFRCVLCVLGRRAAAGEVLFGVEALVAHLAGHRREDVGDDVLGAARCVAGRWAGDGEEFDVNLLPFRPDELRGEEVSAGVVEGRTTRSEGLPPESPVSPMTPREDVGAARAGVTSFYDEGGDEERLSVASIASVATAGSSVQILPLRTTSARSTRELFFAL